MFSNVKVQLFCVEIKLVIKAVDIMVLTPGEKEL